MALPNDSILVTPGSGATVATHLVGSKEYQVVMVASPTGHLQDTLPTWYFWSGFVAGAANRKHLELFNAAGSGKIVRVRKIFIQSNMAAAVHVPQQWNCDRSSAVGTGGTAITGRPADSANTALPAQVTCRAGPTGGATQTYTLFSLGVNGEETLAGHAILPMINWVPEGPNIQEITLNEGQGCYVQQITNSITTTWGVLFVASVE